MIKEKIKKDLDLMKGMDRKQKREHIWEYYRLHIIAIVIIILLIGSLINTIFINPPKKYYVNLTTYGMFVDSDSLDKIRLDLTDKFVEDKEHYEVSTQSFYFSEEDPQMNMAMTQKFMAVISINELDLIIAEEGYFHDLVNNNMIAELETVIPNELLEQYKENIVVSKEIEERDAKNAENITYKEEKNYGLRLSSNAYLEDMGFFNDNLIIGIVSNSSRIKEAVPVLEYILEYK